MLVFLAQILKSCKRLTKNNMTGVFFKKGGGGGGGGRKKKKKCMIVAHMAVMVTHSLETCLTKGVTIIAA